MIHAPGPAVAHRLVIVGAGPTGLAAAVLAIRRGFEVTVLEAGEVGASLRRWGSTRFFSPLSMNLPPDARELLGSALPPDDALLTGREFVHAVLEPLAASAPLAGRVKTRHRVVAIGRAGMSRGDYPAHPLRAERPFRLLVETPDGERWTDADVVLDASGATAVPTAIGAGGVPAPGERDAAPRMIRDLETLDARRRDLAGRRVVLVGHGHSAANAIAALEQAHANVVWVVRSPNLRPCVEVASDPLPERQRVVARANDLAARPPAWLRVERRAGIERIAAVGGGAGGFEIGLSGGRTAITDEIVAMTGHRPDLGFLSELALEIAATTEGTARLSRALANVTDCLSVPSVSPTDLQSGEPGFFMVGAKSYGRSRTFLLKTGYAQLETVLDEAGKR